MDCKGICFKYKVKKSQKDLGRYESGHKRCSSCEIYISYKGKRCPCCGCSLRQKPRNSKARQKIVNMNLQS